jgi:AcrR family transcriptional regulator
MDSNPHDMQGLVLTTIHFVGIVLIAPQVERDTRVATVTHNIQNNEGRVAGRQIEQNHKRIERRQVDKFAERRTQLAASALQTLSELGYARTSLRDIAQNTTFSHGVLHYYFRDKVDLIIEAVKQYKAECVKRYDEVVATATSAEELKHAFSAALVKTLHDDAAMHRLWYDLRNQSLFEASFHADVLAIDASLQEMIWRVIAQYAELSSTPVTVSPSTAYALFDGLFQQALLRHLAGDTGVAIHLQESVEVILDRLVV